MTTSHSQLSLWQAIEQAYLFDETTAVDKLLEFIDFSPQEKETIQKRAEKLVSFVREQKNVQNTASLLMQAYPLSSQEGISLMCIAEAMLRIPDRETRLQLIRDKLKKANWRLSSDLNPPSLIKWMSYGLLAAKQILLNPTWKPLEGIIAYSMGKAMQVFGNQFVMGNTIEEATRRAQSYEAKGYVYSYDMLGEGARTEEDATRYFEAYEKAIHYLGKQSTGKGVLAAPSISVKLSALHPRYHEFHRTRVLAELAPRLLRLAVLAKQYNIGLTVDAEESYRLELSLEIIETVFRDPALQGWEGLGLALQAYQKRAFYVIDFLAELARSEKRRLMVRLVKGAYWDSEIKLSQIEGRDSYPVFTRKTNTDVSYLACAKKLLQAHDAIYPQFATHNAHTVSAILALVEAAGLKGQSDPFEFQCLHGMGQMLYDPIVGTDYLGVKCRIYAPVGYYPDLLPYLVRRLLENGANTSFVNHLTDRHTATETLVADPLDKVRPLAQKAHSAIPLPVGIFGKTRPNSPGFDFTVRSAVQTLQAGIQDFLETRYTPLGPSQYASESELENALTIAEAGFPSWCKRSLADRARCLEKAALLLAEHQVPLVALLVKEGGKTLPDAVGEVREAIDYCYYYARQAEQLPSDFAGRGVLMCISPWNFPLAIFLGQVVAGLVTGNAVLAKPAEQTLGVAAYTVGLLHQAGIPTEVLQLLLGRGSFIGRYLLSKTAIKGVLFTGSTETARRIALQLAEKGDPETVLIAETGGQNALIADSSALVEQLVDDVVMSAFGSAGQRCSALRVLFVQSDIADRVITMLKGALAELKIGNPALVSSDIGPVIDEEAKKGLEAHLVELASYADQGVKLIAKAPLDPTLSGAYFAPCAYELPHLGLLKREVFGPVLHVIRYSAQELDKVLQQIKDTGYGLTFGIHSRIQERVEAIHAKLPVGNTYVNRHMTGAVVGLQPFGGENLSGTGPKAGGPHYLSRLGTAPSQTFNSIHLPVIQPTLPVFPAPSSEWRKVFSTASDSFQTWQAVEPVERLRRLKAGLGAYAEFLKPLLSTAESILVTPQVLKGYTGEYNQLSLAPRGVFLSLSESSKDLWTTLYQWVAALLAGNAVVVGAYPEIQPLFFSLCESFKRAEVFPSLFQAIAVQAETDLKTLLLPFDMQGLLLNTEAPQADQAVKLLAMREGAIIPILYSANLSCLWRCAVERTLTVNTTASGGNTDLLSLGE